MRRLTVSRERGDTLIEVLVAITALATVVSLFYSIMQNSFSQGQIALERTVTQARLNGQAAMIREAQHRFLTTANGQATWSAIVNMVNPGGAPSPSDEEACMETSTRSKFYIVVNEDASGVTVKNYSGPLNLNASYPEPGDGMWVELYKVQPLLGRAYYAFYLKSCWVSSFGGQQQAMRTIVRLYDAQ